jgi:protein phosphatase methylesterase 1
LDPLSWNDYFAQELYLVNRRTDETITHHVYITTPLEKGPLFVTHHGAGSSGLSFALFAFEIRKALPNAGVLSCDARGHGETVVSESPAQALLDLSLELLSEDLVDVINLTQKKIGWAKLPSIVLIGHSLGGAVVTDVAASGKLGNAVLGYGVLDVVEGSAIDALQSMQSYLSSRPKSFPSIASGIEWQWVNLPWIRTFRTRAVLIFLKHTFAHHP